MLSQVLDIDVVDLEANFAIGKSSQEVLHHLSEIHEELSVYIVGCCQSCVLHFPDWPSSQRISLIIHRPNLRPVEESADHVSTFQILLKSDYSLIRDTEARTWVPERQKQAILTESMFGNTHKGALILEVPAVSIISPLWSQSRSGTYVVSFFNC